LTPAPADARGGAFIGGLAAGAVFGGLAAGAFGPYGYYSPYGYYGPGYGYYGPGLLWPRLLRSGIPALCLLRRARVFAVLLPLASAVRVLVARGLR
jgi:hypothetical protein